MINGIFRTLNKKIYLITINTLFTIIAMPGFFYLAAILLELDLLGIILVMIFEASLRLGLHMANLDSNLWYKAKIM